MKKTLSSFIIKHRLVILVVMLALAAVSLLLSFRVVINSDMTQYLPPSSAMKQGMTVMAETWPDDAAESTIRVMADGLTEAEKADLVEKLAAIPYVDSVAHDDSDTYNSGSHSLYILSCAYDYNTPEEASVEKALVSDFAGYNLVYANDDDAMEGLPVKVFLLAVGLLFFILFIMSRSWFEPVLFLGTTGIAVVINAGTNLILGNISNVTNSIAAILQLALSMDYSIILLNRYRQEREQGLLPVPAMTDALTGAFGSIAGSACTTIAGLLALVFMNFRIGRDLGFVLAKGVFISMFCVMTLLPCLIIASDGLIARTAKKAPVLPTGKLSLLGFRCRYVLPFLFLIAFISFYFLQKGTAISFTLTGDDPVAEVFPKTNTIVLVYDSEDEDRAGNLTEKLEADSRVTAVTGYHALVGREKTPEDMAEDLIALKSETGADAGAAMSLTADADLLRLLYYRHDGGLSEPMTMGELLTFLNEDILSRDSLAGSLDDDLLGEAGRLGAFASAENLTTPKTTADLADFLDLDEATVRRLLLYYDIKSDTPVSGRLTAAAFAAAAAEAAADPAFASLIPAEAKASLETLRKLTDTAVITTPVTSAETASLLGMDDASAGSLYAVVLGSTAGYDPGTMTPKAFVDFLLSLTGSGAASGLSLDAAARSQLSRLSLLTDPALIIQEADPETLAAAFDMDVSLVRTVMTLALAGDVSTRTMTPAAFVGFINNVLTADPLFAEAFSEEEKASLARLGTLMHYASTGEALTPAQMAGLLGLPETTVTGLYSQYLMTSDPAFSAAVSGMTMTVTDFLALLKTRADTDALARLEQTETLIMTAVAGQALTAAQTAVVLSLDEAVVSALYAQYGGGTAPEAVPLYAFTHFLVTDILSDPAYASLFTKEQTDSLTGLDAMMGAAVSGTALGAADLAALFGMSAEDVIALMAVSAASGQTLPLPVFTAFLTEKVLPDPALSGYFDEASAESLRQLNTLVQVSAAGTPLTAGNAAALFALDESRALLIYRLYFGSTAEPVMSREAFVDYLVSEATADPFLGAYIAPEAAESLRQLQTLMKASLAGTAFPCRSMAALTGMDEGTVKLIYTLYQSRTGALAGVRLSPLSVVEALTSGQNASAGFVSPEQASSLNRLKAIMQAALGGQSYTADAAAHLFGLDGDQTKAIFLYKLSLADSGASPRLSVKTLVDFLTDTVLSDPSLCDLIADKDRELLRDADLLIEAVVSEKLCDEEAAFRILSRFSDSLEKDTIDLLYLFRAALEDTTVRRMSLDTLVSYLAGEASEDPLFRTFLSPDDTDSLKTLAMSLKDGIRRLKNGSVSRLIISTTLPVESAETTGFIRDLQSACGDFGGPWYLIGNSPMNVEMADNFNDELRLITWLTSAAIFLIVLISFRSLIIPLILVLLVQCSVYITVTVVGLQGYAIYYLALLIVECILMGATIDYGILFTNYYRDSRRTLPVKAALAAAYRGSIHTIMTSGLIIVLVTGILGYTTGPTISQITRTISVGAFCAILMILLILPGILAAADKLVAGKTKA